MSTLEAAFEHLPQPILDKLESMIRRIRRLLFLRGLSATLAVALTCLLVIMAIDAMFTLFSPMARWGLSLAGLSVTLAAAWWFLMRPLSKRLTLTHMARILEIRHPELQERISTAVELLSSDDPDSVKGSEELIRAVVDSAIDDVGSVDPQTEFQANRGKKFVLAAAVCAGVILLTLMIWPKQSWTLLARAMAPFLDIGNAYAESLVIEPGDARIATGDSLEVSVTLNHKRLRRAEFRTLLPDGSDTVERMGLVREDEDGTKKFTLTLPKVEESFQYRIRAGSALSRYYTVEVIDPPAVEELKIHYDFPEYTSLEPTESITETGEIRAVAHTRVRITATMNKPLQVSKLIFNESTDLGTPEIDGKTLTWETELLAGMNGNWHFELTDLDGFTNEPLSYPLEVLPDKSPTVQIALPVMSELRLRPTERLLIEADVVEDFGFLDAALIITPDGAIEPVVQKQDLPVATGTANQYRSSTSLDLAALNLTENQKRIAVQVQVRDDRPTDYDGPGVGLSDPIYITIDRRAKSLADQAIEAQRKELSENLQEAKRELERARDDMRRVEQEMNRSEEVNERARDELDEFSERTESAREKLDLVAATLNQTLFQEQADQAAKVSNEMIQEAREKADLIPVTDEKSKRVQEARESRQKIEEAIREVDQLAKSMRENEDEYRMISQLNDLANRQQELAMSAEEMARQEAENSEQPPQNQEAQRRAEQQQRQQMNQFQSQQNQVQQQLGQMLKDNAAALDEILANQQEQAEGLAEEAAALAEEQQSLKEISEQSVNASGNRMEELREQLLANLQERQESLSQAAQEEAEASAENNPSESEALMEGAEQGFEAAKNLEGEKLNEAAEAAAEASESLAAAAEAESASGENSSEAAESAQAEGDTGEPGEGENAEMSTMSSEEFADQQAALAEQIEAVSSGDLQEALSLMEAALVEEAAALSQETRSFENALKNLSQQSAGNSADQAERSLQRGAQEADQSSRQLSQAQQQQSRAEASDQVESGELAKDARASMQRSQSDQAQSANALRQAANALAQSAKTIGRTMEGLEPSDADSQVADSSDLAEGFEEVSESSRSQDAQEAAQQSQEAASALQQLAQAAMQKLGNPGQYTPPSQGGEETMTPPELTGDPNGEDPNDSGEKGSDIDGDGIPPELQAMGVSAEDWERFRGALVGGNATAIDTDLPAEYRELVGRYFQVIAKEAGKEP
ncbi:MAG: hypothetical protein AAF733_02470 [Verrucomicrobiota bacterium]